MKSYTFSSAYPSIQPQNHSHEALRAYSSIQFNNSLTGNTLLLLQVMYMTPAAVFFTLWLVTYIYRKCASRRIENTFNQEIHQLQQIAALERMLRRKTNERR